jgi:hypothetical protein
VSHYTPGKPARNTLVFHRHHRCETLFSICLHHASLDAFCMPAGLALASSLRVNVPHLTQLTLSRAYPYKWSCFFHHPVAWPRFLHTLPALTTLRLQITQPIQIIAAIAAADAHAAPARLLLDLWDLHLFWLAPPPITKTKARARAVAAAAVVGSIWGSDGGQIDTECNCLECACCRASVMIHRRSHPASHVGMAHCRPSRATGMMTYQKAHEDQLERLQVCFPFCLSCHCLLDVPFRPHTPYNADRIGLEFEVSSQGR